MYYLSKQSCIEEYELLRWVLQYMFVIVKW